MRWSRLNETIPISRSYAQSGVTSVVQDRFSRRSAAGDRWDECDLARRSDRYVPIRILFVHGDAEQLRRNVRRDAIENCSGRIGRLAFNCLLAEAELIAGLGEGEEFHLHVRIEARRHGSARLHSRKPDGAALPPDRDFAP